MFPIHDGSGKIIGYGGRALAADDNPKYLNSPETPIYKKSYVLYNLHRAKEAMRKEDRAILVEGYMDAIGVTAAGFGPVVASCGTALTPQQVKLLKQHTPRIVVNFDPDTAGANAAGALDQYAARRRHASPNSGARRRARSGRVLQGARRGRRTRSGWKTAKGYFYWLADRARTKYDVRTSEGQVSVLKFLMPAVQRISDQMERMVIAGDVASYIGVDRGMVLDSFKKAVADRQENKFERPKVVLRHDERMLINALLTQPELARDAGSGAEGDGEHRDVPIAANLPGDVRAAKRAAGRWSSKRCTRGWKKKTSICWRMSRWATTWRFRTRNSRPRWRACGDRKASIGARN